MSERALIIGAGHGLSACIARLFRKEGMEIAMAARNPAKLKALTAEVEGKAYACDVADAQAVASLFESVDRDLGGVDIVVFNPSRRSRGPLVDLDPAEVREALMVTCYGGFLVGQEATRRMLAQGRGTILFTGASASVKGYPQSAPFAMGKFGLRGLVQSMARELQPKNIHVAHFVIDGGIDTPGDQRRGTRGDDGMLRPEAIAETYLHIHRQHRSAWTWEVELRPWVESF